MTAIRDALSALGQKAAVIAAQTGDKGILATQEVTHAYERGELTKAERKVLHRALSDGTNDVATVQKQLGRYADAFEKGDVSGDGRIQKGERDHWQQALDAWMWTAASTQVPDAEKDALLTKVLTRDHVKKSGEIVPIPVYAIATLLQKLDRLLDD